MLSCCQNDIFYTPTVLAVSSFFSFDILTITIISLCQVDSFIKTEKECLFNHILCFYLLIYFDNTIQNLSHGSQLSQSEREKMAKEILHFRDYSL